MNRYAAAFAPLLLAALAVPAAAAGATRTVTAPVVIHSAPVVVHTRNADHMRAPAFRSEKRVHHHPVNYNPWLGYGMTQGSQPITLCRATFHAGSQTYSEVYQTTRRERCLMVPWGLAGMPWTVVPATDAFGPPEPDSP